MSYAAIATYVDNNNNFMDKRKELFNICKGVPHVDTLLQKYIEKLYNDQSDLKTDIRESEKRTLEHLREVRDYTKEVLEYAKGMEVKFFNHSKEMEDKFSKNSKEIEERFSNNAKEMEARFSNNSKEMEARYFKHSEEMEKRMSSRMDRMEGMIIEQRQDIKEQRQDFNELKTSILDEFKEQKKFMIGLIVSIAIGIVSIVAVMI